MGTKQTGSAKEEIVLLLVINFMKLLKGQVRTWSLLNLRGSAPPY